MTVSGINSSVTQTIVDTSPQNTHISQTFSVNDTIQTNSEQRSCFQVISDAFWSVIYFFRSCLCCGRAEAIRADEETEERSLEETRNLEADVTRLRGILLDSPEDMQEANVWMVDEERRLPANENLFENLEGMQRDVPCALENLRDRIINCLNALRNSHRELAVIGRILGLEIQACEEIRRILLPAQIREHIPEVYERQNRAIGYQQFQNALNTRIERLIERGDALVSHQDVQNV